MDRLSIEIWTLSADNLSDPSRAPPDEQPLTGGGERKLDPSSQTLLGSTTVLVNPNILNFQQLAEEIAMFAGVYNADQTKILAEEMEIFGCKGIANGFTGLYSDEELRRFVSAVPLSSTSTTMPCSEIVTESEKYLSSDKRLDSLSSNNEPQIQLRIILPKFPDIDDTAAQRKPSVVRRTVGKALAPAHFIKNKIKTSLASTTPTAAASAVEEEETQSNLQRSSNPLKVATSWFWVPEIRKLVMDGALTPAMIKRELNDLLNSLSGSLISGFAIDRIA